MNEELEQRFAKAGRQRDEMDPIVIAKYFNPIGKGIWLACEYDSTTKTFWGYCSIWGDWNDEFGDFTLELLEIIEFPKGRKIERDLDFEAKPISECNVSSWTPGSQFKKEEEFDYFNF